MANVLNACPFNLQDGKERILWEITPRCNMNCKHCLFYSNDRKEIKDEITTDQAFEIIDNIKKDKEIKAIWLSGGEPLLRKDIGKICKYIKDAGIKPSISTNGSLLTEELIIELYNSGVEYIHLSIDGANAKTHDELRGVPNAFETLMDKMELLNWSPINVGASFMVTEESINEIEDVLEIAKSKGLVVISFYLVAELGRGAINFKEEKCDLAKKLYEKINQIDKSKYPGLKIEVFRANKSDIDDDDIIQECKGYNFFNITYDGNLGGCPWLMKSEHAFTVGNVLNEDFIELKSKCTKKMKELINNRKDEIQFCKNCKNNKECGKGCVALQINSNNKLKGMDEICPRIRKMEEAI